MAFVIVVKHFRLVVRHIVFDGNDTVENVAFLQNRHRHSHGNRAFAFCKGKGSHPSSELFLHGYAGIILMEGILLQEAQTNHSGNLKSQLLIIRKHIAADQFTISIRLLSWFRIAMSWFLWSTKRESTLVWYQGARSFRYSL